MADAFTLGAQHKLFEQTNMQKRNRLERRRWFKTAPYSQKLGAPGQMMASQLVQLRQQINIVPFPIGVPVEQTTHFVRSEMALREKNRCLSFAQARCWSGCRGP